MSAECELHGCDLLFDGECRECTLEAEVARLQAVLESSTRLAHKIMPHHSDFQWENCPRVVCKDARDAIKGAQ